MPLSFKDHEHYRHLWHYLFGFELLCQIKNSRRDVPKDVLGLAGFEMQSAHTKRQTMWVGYCVMGKQQTYFQSLKMYEEPPHSKNFKPGELTVSESDRSLNKDLRLSHVKEHDLLLLSETKLDLKGHTDIKKIATVEYLRSIILKSDVMLAVVSQKAQGGDKGSLVSLDCVVDV